MADNQLDMRWLPKSDKQPPTEATYANLPVAGSSDNARVARKSDARERELDWNVITLAPDGENDTAAGADVDVLIHVLAGTGRLTTEEGTIRLAPGARLWLPSRSRPQLTAGPDGLRYLTVNQKWEGLPRSGGYDGN
jgi:quercetin dioxygenase-like cupin family protein